MSNLQLHEKKKQIIDVILSTYETGTLKICEILQLHENHKQLHPQRLPEKCMNFSQRIFCILASWLDPAAATEEAQDLRLHHGFVRSRIDRLLLQSKLQTRMARSGWSVQITTASMSSSSTSIRD
jgi:hypothetical protein